MTTVCSIGEDAARKKPGPQENSSRDTRWEHNVGRSTGPSRDTPRGFFSAALIPGPSHSFHGGKRSSSSW